MTVPANAPVTLRGATVEDAAAIAALGSHVFSLTFGHSVTPEQLKAYLDESYSIEATIKDILNPSKDMIVAITQASDDSAEQTVGFALLTRGTSEPCIAHLGNTAVELQRLYVHPDCHGKGAGRELATEIEDMARRQGFRYMWLGVWEHNVKAQAVYGKLGYRVVGDHDFVVGGDAKPNYIMLKDL
jgi:ribosomal protein S18 acetylase RimI-like enzyme